MNSFNSEFSILLDDLQSRICPDRLWCPGRELVVDVVGRLHGCRTEVLRKDP